MKTQLEYFLNRLFNLEKDDSEDVFELFVALQKAETEEERKDVVEAILEIMEQAPLVVKCIVKRGQRIKN